MSWMDSWSRPGKHAAVPPPLYLTQGDNVVYCHTCGRVMSSPKKAQRRQTQGVKYCSDRCRQRKPGAVDKKIESAIVAMLNGEAESGIEKTESASRKIKGDRRNTITCNEIEEVVFGSRHDPTKTFGRKKNRASRALGEPDEQNETTPADDQTSDLEETPPISENTRPLVRPSQLESEVNGSIGGEKGKAERTDETPEQVMKRREGQRLAEQREMVRRAMRRGVVFGFDISKGQATANGDPEAVKYKCEAVMKGSVVEPSFAKGDWAIRWRE